MKKDKKIKFDEKLIFKICTLALIVMICIGVGVFLAAHKKEKFIQSLIQAQPEINSQPLGQQTASPEQQARFEKQKAEEEKQAQLEKQKAEAEKEAKLKEEKAKEEAEKQEQLKKQEADKQKQQASIQQEKPQSKPQGTSNGKAESYSITAIGDSVMLGATPAIQNVLPEAIVDAKSSRQVASAEEVISSLKAQGNLKNTVVLALGTNGPFSEATGQSLINSIGKNRTIYWITMYGKNAYWQDQTNSMIEKVASKNSNVHVIHWENEAKAHPEWFYDDGIHLRTSGQIAYANLILNAVKGN